MSTENFKDIPNRFYYIIGTDIIEVYAFPVTNSRDWWKIVPVRYYEPGCVFKEVIKDQLLSTKEEARLKLQEYWEKEVERSAENLEKVGGSVKEKKWYVDDEKLTLTKVRVKPLGPKYEIIDPPTSKREVFPTSLFPTKLAALTALEVIIGARIKDLESHLIQVNARRREEIIGGE